MNFLRNRWRRTAFHRFFLELDPIDRATFWIGVVLAFAIAISIERIVRVPAAADMFTAPPFELRFAVAGRARS